MLLNFIKLKVNALERVPDFVNCETVKDSVPMHNVNKYKTDACTAASLFTDTKECCIFF